MRKNVSPKSVVVDGLGLIKYRNLTVLNGKRKGYVEIAVDVLRQFGMDIYEDHTQIPAVLRIRPIVPSAYGANTLKPTTLVVEEKGALPRDERDGVKCPNCSESSTNYDITIRSFSCSACGSSFGVLELEGLRLLKLRDKEPFREVPTGKLCKIATEEGVGFIHIDEHYNISGLEVQNEQS
jgi:hypothetical protein